jgi:hypothetical protein
VSEIPVIGIDNSGGPHAGNLYAAFYTWTGSAMKVEVATSTTRGTSWGAPVPVVPPADPNDEFFPWLSVSNGGLVGVTWLDRRYDPQDRQYERFAAISSDGGATFPNLLIASTPSNPKNDGFNGTFMGDYTGNVWNSSGTTLYASRMDTRNGVNTQDEVGGRIGTGSVPAWNSVPNSKVNPASTLAGVVAISATDVWAVGNNGGGSNGQALIEQWNGTSWNVVPSPKPVGPSSSAPNAVTAGSKRTPTPTPSPTPSSTFSALNGVAAVSASDIWAVGNAGNSTTNLTLTEHWNGTSWSVVRSPNAGTSFNTLFAVATDLTADVWAVGSFQTTSGTQTLIEHWNGTAWSVVPSPNGNSASGSSNDLAALGVVSTSDVWAAGLSTDSFGDLVTLTEQWNGTSWQVVPSLDFQGSAQSRVLGVAAITPANVWAVGITGLTEQYCC